MTEKQLKKHLRLVEYYISCGGRAMKKFLTSLIAVLFLTIVLSFALSINYDLGIKIIRSENYTAVTFRYPFYTDTHFIDGEFPKADEYLEIQHKPLDEYHNLTSFEKIVYDSIMTRAINILNLKTDSLVVKVPLNNAELDENISSLNQDAVDLINSADFVKIFQALHKDYQWLFWFEEDMTWTFRGPDVVLTKNGVEGNFEIVIKPAEMFDGGNENLNEYAISLISNINIDELKFDSIKDIQKYVMDNITYAHEQVDGIKYNTADEDTKVITKSITTFFNEDDPKLLCSGYSNIYQMLCDINGFECYTRTGEVTQDGNVENHSWNIYRQDNETYLSDLTNSDTGSIGYKGELLNKRIGDNKTYTIAIDNTFVEYIEK